MGTFASTGAFSTLRSNQGMLNTKRSKRFLINDDLVRFKGNNLKSEVRVYQDKELGRTKKLIEQLNNSEYQKNVLVLAVSVLSVLLGIAVL